MRVARGLSMAVLGAAVVAAVVAVGTGGWLLFGYRPSADDVDPAFLAGTARATTTWTDVHRAALLALLGLLVVVVVLVPVALAGQGRGRRAVGAGVAALVGVVGAVAGAVTIGMVAWDQVALTEVTVGEQLDGWNVPLGDGVRFVLVDGVEVSPGTYATALVVHLVGPVLALGALVVVGGLALGRRRPSLADAATPR